MSNSAPTLHELNQHLFAALLPATHGHADSEPEAKRTRRTKTEPVAEQSSEQSQNGEAAA